MEIEVLRNVFTDKATISNVSVNNVYECHFIEDKDRGLTTLMPIADIKKLKVHGQTCIPYGRYEIVVTKSDRFSKLRGHDVYLPLVLGVPGFTGIRIHTGVRPEDTEGCPLPVETIVNGHGVNSTTAFIKINDKINAAIKNGERVYITIKK